LDALSDEVNHRPMDDYSIETDGFGGFEVRVQRSYGSNYIAGRFPTWKHGRNWSLKYANPRTICRKIDAAMMARSG